MIGRVGKIAPALCASLNSTCFTRRKIGRSPLHCKARLCSSARHTPTVLASAPLRAALKCASGLDSREPRPEPASSKACCFSMPRKGLKTLPHTGANAMPSVYEIVTEKIIKQLESGVAPWRKPWTCQTPSNLITQKEYRGLNVLTLASQGIPSRFWITFNQATKLGGRIRKGEKSSLVIFWNVGAERETTTQDGEKETSRPFLLQYYSVFNLSQAEGVDIPASLLQETRTTDPIQTCDQTVATMPSPPSFELSNKACNSPTNDLAGMP